MRMFKRRKLGQRGVTLLETMVALGLFAITAATTGDFMVQQIRRSAQNNTYTIAYSVAEEHLETVRAARYIDMAGGSEQVIKGDVVFNVTRTVVDDTPAPNLKEVTVTVNWLEPDGPQDVEVKTIYTAVRRF